MLLRSDTATYMKHVDLALVRRTGVLACVLTALATAVTLVVVAPTALIGVAGGWAAAVVFVGALLAAAAWGLRAPRLEMRSAYAIDLALLTGLGLMGWLAQDGDLYSALPVLLLVLTAAVYPPRWVLGAIVVAALAQMPALLAVGADSDSVVELTLHAFTWLCLCGLALMWTAGIRVQRRELHENAREDALTGLGNRRAFDETVATELARVARAGHALSLLVADLDGFKTINDRHGHLAGDLCLQAVARILRDLTRRPDSCFRWGGDEFVVLLPDADGTRARAVALRLADAVRACCVTPDGRPLSLAFGLAERVDEVDAAGLLARADADLRSAKVG